MRKHSLEKREKFEKRRAEAKARWKEIRSRKASSNSDVVIPLSQLSDSLTITVEDKS
jgi:hypothetical protein